jgi:hypothetical protein
MIIDITKLPTFYINLDEKKDRKLKMTNLLSKQKFSHVTRFPGHKADKRVGCSMSHASLLQHIVDNNIYPALVLEDDVQMFNFRSEIEVPDDADAMYLGFSKYGWNNPDEPFPRSLKVKELSEHHHRVHNMLARHAIIHFSPDYDRACIDVMNKFIADPDAHKAGDVQVSSLHPHYKVYALNAPIFYQHDHGTRWLTQVSLHDVDYVEMDKL